MDELINLYHAVTSNDASCGMNKEQQEKYFELNKVFNRLTKSHFNYSICRKKQLISKVEYYLGTNGYTFN